MIEAAVDSFVSNDDPVGRRMLALARTFPALSEHLRGCSRWQPEQLDAWACGSTASPDAREVVRFLLDLWDSRRAWRCGTFDVRRALARWDGDDRQAFFAWAGASDERPRR